MRRGPDALSPHSEEDEGSVFSADEGSDEDYAPKAVTPPAKKRATEATPGGKRSADGAPKAKAKKVKGPTTEQERRRMGDLVHSKIVVRGRAGEGVRGVALVPSVFLCALMVCATVHQVDH